ncbi:hypothetical protein AB9F35_35720, partial [Rhizobium leguminosarum]
AQIPFTMDRSGHRFSGAAFSYVSNYVKDCKFFFPDDAAKRYVTDLSAGRLGDARRGFDDILQSAGRLRKRFAGLFEERLVD